MEIYKREFMNKKNILVVGGAGFIGSHVNKMLHQSGYHTIVLDNLSLGNQKAVIHGTFVEGDIGDTPLLQSIFAEYAIDAVMHFAAFADVGESMILPLKYYNNNVAKTINLLEVMEQFGVKIFIFSSTAAIFGVPQDARVTEDHPTRPINPYGQSKLMVETILRDLDHTRSLRSCCLRYFNAAGGDPEGRIKYYKNKESNLIPIILRSLKYGEGKVTIFGTDYATSDGTCIRDYVHIEDLGAAHITAMEQLLKGAPSNHYNLGNGHGFSVRQVIATTARVIKRKINIVEGPKRMGDPPVLVANAQKAHRELKWEPKYSSLDTIIQHAWEAMK